MTIVAASGCEKSKPPAPQSTATPDSHPVKNVESLPSGTVQEGARTMNKSADMGGSLEQQKQERDKEVESQGK
ncbi:MAG TPA: hypothetical protein VIU02_06915 [Burkholderiales bacterium]